MARRKCTYDIPATLDDALIHFFFFNFHHISVLLTLRGVLLLRVHLSSNYFSPPLSRSLGFQTGTVASG